MGIMIYPSPPPLQVSGHTYNPNEGVVVSLPRLDASLESIAEICAVCNEAVLECKAGVFKAVGAPTEAALKVGGEGEQGSIRGRGRSAAYGLGATSPEAAPNLRRSPPLYECCACDTRCRCPPLPGPPSRPRST